MQSKHKPSFDDWPPESIAQLTAIMEPLFRKVIREELHRTEVNTDAAYLASLTKEEYDRLMRGMK